MKRNILLFVISVIILAGIIPGRSALTAVDLLYFIATPGTSSIVLTWETATEFDNIGFYVQRGYSSIGPFTRISPRIISLGDPLIGHIYNYEDETAEIAVQYYYVLEILNADNTSDFSAPVGAIIPGPTVTPTLTSTRTPTPIQLPSLTATPTSTIIATNTVTLTSILPTNTITSTLPPTATNTRTPTTTLEPITVSGIDFPARTQTTTLSPENVRPDNHVTEVIYIKNDLAPTNHGRIQLIFLVSIILWLVLAVFLFFIIRYINRGTKHS